MTSAVYLALLTAPRLLFGKPPDSNEWLAMAGVGVVAGFVTLRLERWASDAVSVAGAAGHADGSVEFAGRFGRRPAQ